ncbi:MAG: hypothetical protein CHACPFDD_01648 [Phycisphaerae bacterium]|nr:hypothetical protein [Phycisphaerae bacterium]
MGMGKAALAGLIVLCLTGCAERPPAIVLRAADGDAPCHRRACPARVRYEPRRSRPNLVLGPTAEHARIAALLDERGARRAVISGWRLEDYQQFDELIYDDQSFSDTLGGYFYRTGLGYRRSAIVR